MDRELLKMGQKGLKIVFWTKKHLIFCFKKLVNLALKPASNASVLPRIVQPGYRVPGGQGVGSQVVKG